MEKLETIVASSNEKDFTLDPQRLAYSRIAGPGITLAFMAEDKTHVCCASSSKSSC